MAESPLAHKLKLKPGQRTALIDPPAGYLVELSPLPQDVEIVQELNGVFDWVQIFVKNKLELDALLPRVLGALKPDSLLWISFPKGTSKIQTDLTRDKGWEGPAQSRLKMDQSDLGQRDLVGLLVATL